MYIEIPNYGDMTAEQQARETERILREIQNKTNKELEDLRIETAHRIRKLEAMLYAENR